MAEYELFEPFEIDHGELDGLDNQLSFCLGAEFVQWRERFKLKQENYDEYVIKENAERLLNMARRFGYEGKLEPYDDEWTALIIRKRENE